MREVVRYFVQAFRDGKWVTIRNTTSYKKAVVCYRKSEIHRRLMVQTLQNDMCIWLSEAGGISERNPGISYPEWMAQTDDERDAREMKRRQL